MHLQFAERGFIEHRDAFPRGDIAATGRVGPEAPHIHVPHIESRLAIYDPVRHHPADTARAGDTMRAEAAGDPEAACIRRLAQDKLSVRRERLQPVDTPD